MNTLIRFFSILFFSLSAVTTHAGSADAGKLMRIDVVNDRLVIVYSSGERTMVPNCAKRLPSWWAIDLETVAGQEQLRELTKLKEKNKSVRIVGTGGCGALSNAEAISFFYPVSETPTQPLN